MPTYSLRNTKTDEEWEEFFTSHSKLEEYLEENKHITQLITTAIPIGDPMKLGRKKTDSKFRDQMNRIRNAHHGSTIPRQNITEI